MGLRNTTATRSGLTALSVVLLSATLAVAADVFVEAGHSMKYLTNTSDPAVGLGWTVPLYDDSTPYSQKTLRAVNSLGSTVSPLQRPESSSEPFGRRTLSRLTERGFATGALGARRRRTSDGPRPL
jgi:hypothetical protein